jgi:DNA-binding IclR family transcriptional regulator
MPRLLQYQARLFLADNGRGKVREYAQQNGLPASTPGSTSALQALEAGSERVRRQTD